MPSVFDRNVVTRHIPYIYIYIYIYIHIYVRNLKVSDAPNHSSDVMPSRNPIE